MKALVLRTKYSLSHEIAEKGEGVWPYFTLHHFGESPHDVFSR